MSKDRIEEILKSITPITSESLPKAMEQYGNERYDTGYTKGWVDGLVSATGECQQLVEAQREFIELILTCEIKNGMISMSLYQAKKREEIMKKIKQLEK